MIYHIRRASYFILYTASAILHTPYFIRRTSYSILHASCFMLHASYSMFLTLCFTLDIKAHQLRGASYFMLYTSHFILFRYIRYTSYFVSRHTSSRELRTVCFILYTFTLYSIAYALYQGAPAPGSFVLHTLYFILYTL